MKMPKPLMPCATSSAGACRTVKVTQRNLVTYPCRALFLKRLSPPWTASSRELTLFALNLKPEPEHSVFTGRYRSTLFSHLPHVMRRSLSPPSHHSIHSPRLWE